MGSLSEPVSCIVGTYHAMYHIPQGTYIHDMGIREGGSLAILAGVGPMGLGAIDYAIHAPVKPGLLVVNGYRRCQAGAGGIHLYGGRSGKNGCETDL